MQPVNPLRLALIQSDIHWQDPEANRRQLDAVLAALDEVDVVVLPEMFSTGFSMDTQAAEPLNGPTQHWMQQWAIRLNVVVAGSLMLRSGTQCVNRLLWVTPEGEVAGYDKRHLFRMGNEHLHYQPGTERVLLQWRGWRIRPQICYDLRFPVWSRDAQGTDLLLYVANWPGARGAHWNALLTARAIENLCYVAGVNRIGQDGNGWQFAGATQALDFRGEYLGRLGDVSGVLRVELDPLALQAYRRDFPAHLDADPFELIKD